MAGLIGLLWSMIVWSSATHATTDNPHHLTLTALLSDDNGKAFFQCWQMSTPFIEYPTVGSAVPTFAQVSNMTYVVLPPRSDEGLHKPPFPM